MSPTVLEDNASIGNDEILLRRVPLLQLVLDEDTGLARISSGAFKHREMSINLESTMRDAGQAADTCLMGYPNQILSSVKAGEARRCNQAICRDPLPGDLSHGLVYGNKNGRIPERLRAFAVWVIPSVPPLYQEIEQRKRTAGLSK